MGVEQTNLANNIFSMTFDLAFRMFSQIPFCPTSSLKASSQFLSLVRSHLPSLPTSTKSSVRVNPVLAAKIFSKAFAPSTPAPSYWLSHLLFQRCHTTILYLSSSSMLIGCLVTQSVIQHRMQGTVRVIMTSYYWTTMPACYVSINNGPWHHVICIRKFRTKVRR